MTQDSNPPPPAPTLTKANGKRSSLARAVQTPSFEAGLLVETTPNLDKDRLAFWIREKSSPEGGKKQCSVFALYHDGERGLRPVTPGPVIPKKASHHEREKLITDIVMEFDEASRNIAYTYPRVQRFEVAAYVSEAEDAEP